MKVILPTSRATSASGIRTAKTSFRKLRLTYNKVRAPEQIKDDHIRELKLAVEFKTKELETRKNQLNFCLN